MVHINEEGEILELEGSLLDLGADISCLIAITVSACKEEGLEKGDIARYIATILKTAIDVIKDKEAKDGIKDGCMIAIEYGGMDNKFRIYKNNGSLTGYKS